MATMSRAEIERCRARLSKKRKLSTRQQVQLLALGAVLHNGGEITVQRDHTPKRWWQW